METKSSKVRGSTSRETLPFVLAKAKEVCYAAIDSNIFNFLDEFGQTSEKVKTEFSTESM